MLIRRITKAIGRYSSWITSVLPLEQMPSEGELGVVDDGTVDLHEGSDIHVAVFAKVVFEA